MAVQHSEFSRLQLPGVDFISLVQAFGGDLLSLGSLSMALLGFLPPKNFWFQAFVCAVLPLFQSLEPRTPKLPDPWRVRCAARLSEALCLKTEASACIVEPQVADILSQVGNRA